MKCKYCKKKMNARNLFYFCKNCNAAYMTTSWKSVKKGWYSLTSLLTEIDKVAQR